MIAEAWNGRQIRGGPAMNPRFRMAVVVAVLSWCVPGSASGQGAAADEYEQAFEALRALAPRADRAAAVRDFVLRRDAAEIRFTVGAAFVGQGSVSFVPPLPVERAHLRRVLGDSVIDAPISAAVLLFADSTLAELERGLTFATGDVAAGVADRVHDALEFVSDGRERWADAALMDALLNGAATGFFAAYVKRRQGEDLMIQVTPHDAEEMQLLRRGKQTGQRVETVSQFQRAEDLRDTSAIAGEAVDPLRIEAYRIESTIGSNLGC